MLEKQTRNQPLISVITPSYNQAEFLEENILSVKNQDYPNIEHIIIDGGSKDGSLEIIERYANDLTWISEPDNGQSHAINKGFKMAKGEIIGWINSDDYYLPRAVGNAIDVLTANSGVDLVYGYCAKVNENSHQTGLFKSPEFDRKLLFSNPNVIYQPAVFFRKALLDKVGLLDESLHYAMDFDLWVRMAKASDFKLIPEALAAFRFSSGCKSVADSQKFWQEVDGILRKNDDLNISRFYLALHKSKMVHMVWDRIRSPLLMKVRNRLFGFWDSDN